MLGRFNTLSCSSLSESLLFRFRFKTTLLDDFSGGSTETSRVGFSSSADLHADKSDWRDDDGERQIRFAGSLDSPSCRLLCLLVRLEEFSCHIVTRKLFEISKKVSILYFKP